MKAWVLHNRNMLLLWGLFGAALLIAPCLAGAGEGGASAPEPSQERWTLGPSQPLPEVRQRP